MGAAQSVGVVSLASFYVHKADLTLSLIGDESRLGKPVGSDLRQGLFTLPVLYYLQAYPDDPRFRRASEECSEYQPKAPRLGDRP